MVEERTSEVIGPDGKRVIFKASRRAFSGFIDFIRERGVMGLAIGFIMGGAVSKITTSLSSDVLNPMIASIFGGGTARIGDWVIGSVAIGKFIASIIDFLVLALVVYLIFRVLGLDTLDKKQ